MRDAQFDAHTLLGRRVAVIFRFVGDESEEYEDWHYKVRIFMHSECSLIARSLTFLESLDREADARSEDLEQHQERPSFSKVPSSLMHQIKQGINTVLLVRRVAMQCCTCS